MSGLRTMEMFVNNLGVKRFILSKVHKCFLLTDEIISFYGHLKPKYHVLYFSAFFVIAKLNNPAKVAL